MDMASFQAHLQQSNAAKIRQCQDGLLHLSRDWRLKEQVDLLTWQTGTQSTNLNSTPLINLPWNPTLAMCRLVKEIHFDPIEIPTLFHCRVGAGPNTRLNEGESHCRDSLCVMYHKKEKLIPAPDFPIHTFHTSRVSVLTMILAAWMIFLGH